MSAGKRYATLSGFIGHNGSTARLDEGDEYDADHELVKAHPDKFSATPPTTAVDERPARKRAARS